MTSFLTDPVHFTEMSNDSNSQQLITAASWLKDAQNIVVFTGAGISSASGIATFRDEDGFWSRFPPEDFANWKGLIQTALLQPKRLSEFLIAILEPIATAQPNDAHRAIVTLGKFRTVNVVTQNIDRLHQDAGSNIVFEIHGNLFEVLSYPSGKKTHTLTKADLADLINELNRAQLHTWSGPRLIKAISPMMGISTQGAHRPNLVLFGDQLAEPDWSSAQGRGGEL